MRGWAFPQSRSSKWDRSRQPELWARNAHRVTAANERLMLGCSTLEAAAQNSSTRTAVARALDFKANKGQQK
jgi:hypothetical protein